MNQSWLKGELEAAFEQYTDKIRSIANLVFLHKVKPYLDKKGYEFAQCNTDWWIIYQGKTYHSLSFHADAETLMSKTKQGKEVCDLLNTEITSQPSVCLANYMPTHYVPNA